MPVENNRATTGFFRPSQQDNRAKVNWPASADENQEAVSRIPSWLRAATRFVGKAAKQTYFIDGVAPVPAPVIPHVRLGKKILCQTALGIAIL